MSRNGSGTYSLPAGNPVVTGTTISSSVMNTTLSDIATALTGSIAADGQTPITANLPMGGYILTGLGAGSGAGQSIRYEQLFTSGTVSLLGVLSVQDGTQAAPGVRFSSSSTTGLFSSSDNTVRITCNNAEAAKFTGNGMTVTAGGITFPATQVASADANTLDDYEEGAWSPALTFATPGDLSVTYSFTPVGTYTKIGRFISATCDIVTSAFTFTTASGNLQITGFPFTTANTSNLTHSGAGSFQGITKASYTDFSARMAHNSSTILIGASGSGQSVTNVTASDCPSGGTMVIRFTIALIV